MGQDLYEKISKAFENPVLTERLEIRLLVREDFRAFVDFLNREDMAYPRHRNWPVEGDYTAKYLMGRLFPALEKNDRERGGRDLVCFNRAAETPDIIGILRVGANYSPSGSLKISYYVTPELRGQGYAGEAYLAAANRCRDEKLCQKLYAEIFPGNLPSRTFIEKMGLLKAGFRKATTPGFERDYVLFYEADLDQIASFNNSGPGGP